MNARTRNTLLIGCLVLTMLYAPSTFRTAARASSGAGAPAAAGLQRAGAALGAGLALGSGVATLPGPAPTLRSDLGAVTTAAIVAGSPRQGVGNGR